MLYADTERTPYKTSYGPPGRNYTLKSRLRRRATRLRSLVCVGPVSAGLRPAQVQDGASELKDIQNPKSERWPTRSRFLLTNRSGLRLGPVVENFDCRFNTSRHFKCGES